jgi:hypothetical protein
VGEHNGRVPGGAEAGTVRVLESDPDLAAALDARTAEIARRHAVASVIALPRGPWDAPGDPQAHRGELGLLVLEGTLVRDMRIGAGTCSELLGPGDVLRPWDASTDRATVAAIVEWETLTPVRLAVLDRAFTATIGRIPELTTAIVARSVRRARWTGLHLAIRCVKRVELRLLLLFWHLADRFGRVTPEGVVIPLSLTHARLGRLVGAQRPSVTTALGKLAERGLVRRRHRGDWLLCGELPAELASLLAAGGARAVVEAGPVAV